MSVLWRLSPSSKRDQCCVYLIWQRLQNWEENKGPTSFQSSIPKFEELQNIYKMTFISFFTNQPINWWLNPLLHLKFDCFHICIGVSRSVKIFYSWLPGCRFWSDRLFPHFILLMIMIRFRVWGQLDSANLTSWSRYQLLSSWFLWFIS